MKGKILPLLIAITLLTPNIVKAEPTLQQQKQNANTQIQQSETAIDQIQQQSSSLEGQIEMLDEQMEQHIQEVEKLKLQQKELEDEIKKKTAEIKDMELKLSEQQEVYTKRLTLMYNHSTSYLEILLSAEGIGDFINRYVAVKQIVKYDQEQLRLIQEGATELTNEKTKLKKSVQDLEKLKLQQEKLIKTLGEKQTQQKQLLERLKVEESKYADQIAKAKAELVKIQQEEARRAEEERKRREEEAKKNNKNINDIPATASAAAIVAYATRDKSVGGFLGLPYLWGGTGRPLSQDDIDRYKGTSHDISDMTAYIGQPAYDCSGFTSTVYRHFGITLNRVAADQQDQGQFVSRSELRMGDLVFFGSPAHHVGIYVGNGAYVHAPYSGTVIKISSLDGRSDFWGGRRMIP